MRLHPWLGGGLALALILGLPGACSDSNGAAGDGGADVTAADGDDAAEPAICLEFTEAGAPCSTASPVRCFAECEAGGCSCMATSQGPRWACQSDLSCMPDCGPLDDGCSPPGDDSGDDVTGDDAGDEGGGDSAVNDGGGDGAGSDGAGEGGADAGPGDAGGASG
jgi:hypothetical protein